MVWDKHVRLAAPMLHYQKTYTILKHAVESFNRKHALNDTRLLYLDNRIKFLIPSEILYYESPCFLIQVTVLGILSSSSWNSITVKVPSKLGHSMIP